MVATLTPEIEVLDNWQLAEDLVVRIGSDFYAVRDCLDHWEFRKEVKDARGVTTWAAPYRVYTACRAKAKSCTCPAGRYGRSCRHKAAVSDVLAARW